MSLNPLLPFYLAVGSSDASVRIFDRRMLSTKSRGCLSALVSRFLLPEMEGKRRRITSIDYRPDGEEVLVSFSSDYIYTFDPRVKDFIRYLIEEIGCSIRDP
jgi:nuclear receptor interaction protein